MKTANFGSKRNIKKIGDFGGMFDFILKPLEQQIQDTAQDILPSSVYEAAEKYVESDKTQAYIDKLQTQGVSAITGDLQNQVSKYITSPQMQEKGVEAFATNTAKAFTNLTSGNFRTAWEQYKMGTIALGFVALSLASVGFIVVRGVIRK